MVPDDELYCSGSNRAVQRDMSRRIVQFQVFMYSDRAEEHWRMYFEQLDHNTQWDELVRNGLEINMAHHTSNKILEIENSFLEPPMHTYQLAAI